ncbi:MAG: chloride channel protein, partial [Lentisphaeria bacterium]|nr:chloride channel protein [Lentisphaeria bacterium]
MHTNRQSRRAVRLRRFFIAGAKWYRKTFGERSSTLIMALLIGVIAALGVALMHFLVVTLTSFSGKLESYNGPALLKAGAMALFFFLPLIGLFLSHCVQHKWGGRHYAKSLSPLILMLHRRKFSIPGSEMFTHLLSSAFSVGCGGSAGLEAPSVLTGSAVGSNTAGFLHADPRQRLLLIGCGAAAAISACFSSPIGGVLFAVEVLMPSFSVGALVPILMSSAVATVVSRVVSNHFGFTLAITVPWRTDAVPFYFICGLVCAVIGVYVIKAAYKLGAMVKSRLRNHWVRLFTGGVLLCLLLASFPVLRGQGYIYIEQLFSGNLTALAKLYAFLPDAVPQWLILTVLIASAIFAKVVGSVLTVDSGGDGGIFAPSMFIGAFTGFAFARLINLTGIIQLQEPNFIVVGMCGVFTAVMRAPLTGIFLIAEVTGGYTLLVPLMIVSAVSWFAARRLEPNSIYRKALAENNLLNDDRDQEMLQSLPVRLNIERDFIALAPDDTISNMRKLVEEHKKEIFPVIDEHHHLVGVIHTEKMFSAMLEHAVYDFMLIYDLMESPHGLLSPDDDLAWAMANFDRYNVKYLPVCSSGGKFEGFISREEIFSKYRRIVR